VQTARTTSRPPDRRREIFVTAARRPAREDFSWRLWRLAQTLVPMFGTVGSMDAATPDDTLIVRLNDVHQRISSLQRQLFELLA
jgi:hypothetical protein